MYTTPSQFAELLTKLLEAIERIADQQYTITGAADWPIAAFIVGAMATLLCFMWRDLRSAIRDNREAGKDDVSALKAENSKAHDDIWAEIHNCQNDCCPRKKE